MRYLDSTIRKTVLAATAAAFIVGLAACGDDDDAFGARNASDQSASESLAELSAPPSAATSVKGQPAAPATGGARQAGGPGANGSTNGQAVTLDRKIIFNAKLDLQATDVRASFSDVSRLARGVGGFIERSSLDERPSKEDTKALYATLSMRVPSAKYGDVVADLRALQGVKITKEQSSANEVTEQYTDLTSRQRNLERSEGQYLRLLEQAKTIQEILTVNERLDSVRLQIEQIQGKLKVLDNLTDLATLDVTIAPPPLVAVKSAESGPKSVREAFTDAWSGSVEVARYLAAAGAVIAVAVIWLAVPVLLAISGVGLVRRHQRQPVSTNG